MTGSLEQVCRGELLRIEARGLVRRLLRFGTYADGWAELEGRQVLMLGSNDYLGLAGDRRIKALLAEAAGVWGAGATGSRLLSGDRGVHHDLERALANLKGTDDAVLFPSGYLANLGTIPALAGPGDVILSDELNHASIIDGCRLSRAAVIVYPHCDASALERLISTVRGGYRRCLIITDGVFSMDGDLAPLREICDIAERYDAWVMVDDAHGTAVLGENGGGSAEHLGVTGRVHIQMGTLSKALASQGGFIACSTCLAEFLRNRARTFMFGTALAPVMAAAGLAALGIARESPGLRRRLGENAQALRSGLRKLGYKVGEGVTPIIPLVVGDASLTVRLSGALLSLGVYAPAIRPPAVPEGSSRLRITACAAHRPEDIEFALAAFARAGHEVGML